MTRLQRLNQVFSNYVLAPILGKPSTKGFWYLPAPAFVTGPETLKVYEDSTPVPRYLMDYRRKVEYPLVDGEGILVLPYGAGIGNQINPEAAFQLALGMHDLFVVNGSQDHFLQFLRYADYFQKIQDERGLWPYCFDWFRSKSPWYSALAQSRGTSVMLRAWMHTGEDRYRMAACKSVDLLRVPVEDGGFLRVHPWSGTPYFEEYPSDPTAVINGFMAALFGVWELTRWTGDEVAKKLWDTGIKSLEKMLPYYSTDTGWSLYDLDEGFWLRNSNSVFYHCMEIEYLRIFSAIHDSSIIRGVLEAWSDALCPWNRAKYSAIKAFRKIMYR